MKAYDSYKIRYYDISSFSRRDIVNIVSYLYSQAIEYTVVNRVDSIGQSALDTRLLLDYPIYSRLVKYFVDDTYIGNLTIYCDYPGHLYASFSLTSIEVDYITSMFGLDEIMPHIGSVRDIFVGITVDSIQAEIEAENRRLWGLDN